MKRNGELFGIDGMYAQPAHAGKYGFGTERTLADYEAYAGISFAYRDVKLATLEPQLPVRNVRRPNFQEAWKATPVRANEVHICKHKNDFKLAVVVFSNKLVLLEAKAVHVSIYARDGVLLHEKKWDEGELSRCRDDSWLSFAAAFQSELEKLHAHYVVELLNEAGQVIATREYGSL